MESENTEPEHIINRARKRCYRARSRCWAEMVEGADVSEDAHVTLSHAVLAYYDALMQVEPDVDALPDIEPLMSRVGQKTEIIVQSGGWDGDLTTEEVPSVVEVPADELIQMSKELDDAAQQLDFADSSR